MDKNRKKIGEILGLSGGQWFWFIAALPASLPPILASNFVLNQATFDYFASVIYNIMALIAFTAFCFRGAVNKWPRLVLPAAWLAGLLAVVFFRVMPGHGHWTYSPGALAFASIVFTAVWIPLAILQARARSVLWTSLTVLISCATLLLLGTVIIPLANGEVLRSYKVLDIELPFVLLTGTTEAPLIYEDVDQGKRRVSRQPDGTWTQTPIDIEGIVTGYHHANGVTHLLSPWTVSEDEITLTVSTLQSGLPAVSNRVWTGPRSESTSTVQNALSPSGRFVALADGSTIDIESNSSTPVPPNTIEKFERTKFIEWARDRDVYWLYTSNGALVQIDAVKNQSIILAREFGQRDSMNIEVSPDSNRIAYFVPDGMAIMVRNLENDAETRLPLTYAATFSRDQMSESHARSIHENARLAWLNEANLLHLGRDGVLYQTNIESGKSKRLTMFFQPVRSAIWNPDTQELMWTTTLGENKSGVHYRKLSL